MKTLKQILREQILIDYNINEIKETKNLKIRNNNIEYTTVFDLFKTIEDLIKFNKTN